jgi:hypothetical protein
LHEIVGPTDLNNAKCIPNQKQQQDGPSARIKPIRVAHEKIQNIKLELVDDSCEGNLSWSRTSSRHHSGRMAHRHPDRTIPALASAVVVVLEEVLLASENWRAHP